MVLRHFKSNKPIGNFPICVDDFGNLVFRCHYTGHLVTTAEAIFFGSVIPQSINTYVCSPTATEAFKDAKRAFDEIDANCNACKNFNRLPFNRDNNGLMKGWCSKILRFQNPQGVYNLNKGQNGTYWSYWVHPDDSMNMPCWEARSKKEKK
jgi:hypothetical protein